MAFFRFPVRRLTISEEIQFTNETYTKTKIVLHTQNGDVVTYLAAPEHPRAAIVYVPEPAKNLPDTKSVWFVTLLLVMHFSLWIFAVMEGRLPGYPFNPRQDYSLFEKGEWPQVLSYSLRSRGSTTNAFPGGSTFLSTQWGPATGAVMRLLQPALIRDFPGMWGSRRQIGEYSTPLFSRDIQET